MVAANQDKTQVSKVASKKFVNSKIVSPKIQSEDFNKMPSWAFIENKEIKISSTEIRNQREKLRGKN